MDTKRTSMSVPEMGRWLGMGKTESYWIIRKFHLETVLVGSGTKKYKRVLMDSFEKWYAGQDHYKKVCEKCPVGASFQRLTPDPRPEEEQIKEIFGDRIIYSVEEASHFLCISKSVMYDLVNLRLFPSEKVNNKILIPADLFHEWAEQQTSFSLSEDYDERKKMMERFKGCFFNQHPGTGQPVNIPESRIKENAKALEAESAGSQFAALTADEEAAAALRLQQEQEDAQIQAMLEKIKKFNGEKQSMEESTSNNPAEEGAEAGGKSSAGENPAEKDLIGKNFYDVKEVAKILNCSRSHIHVLIEKNTLRSKKIGRKVFIYKEDFDTWYKDNQE